VKELKWKRYKRKRSARDHSSSSDGSGSVRHADHSADPAPAGDRARTQEPSSSSAGASAECLFGESLTYATLPDCLEEQRPVA
jgi:hypothetical protein